MTPPCSALLAVWMAVAAAASLLLLLLPRPAIGRSNEDAAAPTTRGPLVGDSATDPGAACAFDASGDAALRDDPHWLCAVARARCLAQHVHNAALDTSKAECEKEMCNNLPENLTGTIEIMDGTPTLEPKLYCRTTSSLVWHWAKPDHQLHSLGVFVVSVREGDETWILHNVVSEEELIIDKLPSDTKFQLRVQSVTEDGSLSGSCSSEWASTLNVSFSPLPVMNVTVAKEYQFSENHVNMSIQWEPNREDMTCDYKILYWNVHGQRLEETDYHMEFTALLSNLDFNNSYRAYVISGDGNSNKWGEKAVVNITTPSCLDVWNDNLSICSPPPPAKLHINFLSVGMGQFDMNISWIPGRILPQRYIVFMSEVESPSQRSEHKVVDGNKTSVIFKNTKPATLYLGCITAISSAGNSTHMCDYRKFRAPITKKWEYGEIAIVVIVSLAVFCIMMLLIVCLCLRHNKKRKENLRRCQYFEDLEKEPPKEKNYESTALYFDDEWEIPEDRLIVDFVLGEGAFGVVRRGVLQGKSHLDPLQEVAVKMLRDNPNLEDIRQFQQEINMMKSVGKHPHIVSIIGCCTCSKQAKLIVEYCALGDLQNYLRQNLAKDIQNLNQSQDKPIDCVKYAELMSAESNTDAEYERRITPSFAVNQMYFEKCVDKKSENDSLQPADLFSFARQIAMGMECLASNRIVHRDLAARNVLVCANKTVKISDFGLSRDIYEQNVYQKKGDGKLPIKWMAIESLMYQIYTTQSDIWSFGVLLWEIVTLGGMPYPSTPASRIFQLLKTGYRMECPPNCSQELYDIMLSCWRVKPKDRPTFTELHNKLDSLLETASPQQYLNLNIINVQTPKTSSSAVDQLSDH